jgi:hypothetical protein
VSNVEMLNLEQSKIDSFNRDNLYNLCFTVKSGGAETLCIPVYLLDLKGNIVHKFKSYSKAGLFLNGKLNKISSHNINNSVNLKCVNDGRIYRGVTPEFYNNNLDLILQWKPYSCKTAYKYNFIVQYRVFNNSESYTFNTMIKCGELIKVSRERVRQLINSNIIHKKSGLYIEKVVIDKNTY